jgi:hypothetical protein
MEKILNLFSHIYSWHIKSLEKRIGYHVEFTHIPDTWINSWMTFDMKKSWAKHGIHARGVNYFTMGSLKSDISSRFIHTEKQYQSWLGGYLVQFEEEKDFTLQDHLNLAIADQKNWLEDFGDPDPFIKMPHESAAKEEDVQWGNYRGKLYEFRGGISHSDEGNKTSNLHNRIIMNLMAAMFNHRNTGLKLRGRNFIFDDKTGFYDNYETVTLRGYIAIIDLDPATKLVLYGNGTAILNKDGSEVDYFPLIRKDILKAFRSVKIEKI